MCAFKTSFLIGLCSNILWFAAFPSALAGKPRAHDVISRDRKESELDAFKRFEYWRSRDEYRERREYDRRNEHRRLATMFINGQNLPWTRAAFLAAVEQVETSPGAADVFQVSVPPLESDQFVASTTFANILRSDGSLAAAPPVLVGGGHNSPLDAARLEMENTWWRTLQLVGSDALVSQEHVASMQRALERWRQRAAQNLARSDSLARLRGERYLKSVAALIQVVEDPARREQLRGYYHGNGAGFEGGTVADLVHHVVSNNLSLRPGSRAHLILSELGHDMLRDLDGQVYVADQRVEYYKGQVTQSSLDPEAHRARWPQSLDAIGLQNIPQGRDAPSPGSVNTSAERLRRLLGDEEGYQSTEEPSVVKHVTWRN